MRTSILIAAALIAAPTTAIASPVNSTEFEKSVQHDDLDLTTQEGVAVLDQRVRTQIRRACANGGRDSASQRLERECRESALAAAMPDVEFAIAQANVNRPRFAENSSPAASGEATPGA